MIDPNAIIQSRVAGEIRYAVVTDFSGNLAHVLAKFGLSASADSLTELTRDRALAALTQLLWKDMAYSVECMQEANARELAGQIFAQCEYPASQYFSNAAWDQQGRLPSWTPFTESTFDSGLVITGPDHRFFCIWFQDED